MLHFPIPVLSLFKGLLILLALTFTGSFKNQSLGTLTLIVNGIHSEDGEIEGFLFQSEDGFPDNNDKVFRKVRAKIIKGQCILRFEDLPYGDYAGGAFHDENSNGELDENFIGIPKEGIGISNMPRFGLFNQPKYKKARFEFIGDKEIQVTLKYF